MHGVAKKFVDTLKTNSFEMTCFVCSHWFWYYLDFKPLTWINIGLNCVLIIFHLLCMRFPFNWCVIIILSILYWNIWLLIADFDKSEHSLRTLEEMHEITGVFSQEKHPRSWSTPIILTLDAYNRSGLWAYACLCPYTVYRCMRNVSSKRSKHNPLWHSWIFHPIRIVQSCY